MNTLFVAWQDPIKRIWQAVARLTFENNRFRFMYTKGAKTTPNFLPFGRMNDLHSVYESRELFPLFTNRILAKNRPEYKEFLKWLNISNDNEDPLVFLGRSGGTRGTDSLVIFPCPEPTPEGKYTLPFFSHGLRYLPKDALEVIENLEQGTQLFLLLDVQNPHDPFALALRTEKPVCIVGYVPKYFAEDFSKLLKSSSKDSVKIIVDRINKDAPFQLRLLCRISADWPQDFTPCSSDMYQPLASHNRTTEIK